MVLIETSWNVKDGKGSDYWIGDICINRNIVECKVEESYKARTLASCINRNIVECKVLERAQELKQETSINRNIVECKGKRKYVQLRFPDVLIETSWNVKTGIYPLSLAVW